MLITSPFGSDATPKEVLAGRDLAGRTAIVTGGAAGLGLETARALADAGADVLIAARRADQAEAAVSEIAKTARGSIGWSYLDLSSFKSIRAFAESWGARPLDILVANAGIGGCPLTYTEDGLEMQIGTNHFGHHLLSSLLASSMSTAAERSGCAARLVVLSSTAYRFSGVLFDDMHFRKTPYDPWKSYGQSKSANILFALKFDELYKDKGIRAFSLMPGRIFTDFQRHSTKQQMQDMGMIDAAGNPLKKMKTAEQGAATSIWAAVGQELEGAGGLYLEDCAELPPVSAECPAGLEPSAIDPHSAQRLWRISVETTGV